MARADNLAEAVDQPLVLGLMSGRPPVLVSADFASLVRGVAARVAPLSGTKPPDDDLDHFRWDLAVYAVALGTAVRIESGEFPEQQGLGDAGAASSLRTEYLAVIRQLEGSIEGDDGSIDADGVPAPTGSFPPAPIYPDPAFGEPWYCR